MKLKIKNIFTKSLPSDPVLENSRRQVSGACYSYATPKKTKNPQLIHVASEVALELGITEEEVKAKTAEGIKAQMAQYGMMDFAGAELDNSVASMMSKEDHVNQTKDAILEEKIFEYLKANITVKDKSVTLEDFNKQ